MYNCDETGLFWKALPKKTLASSSESSAAGYKVRKERISILVCSNASGCHQLPLAVIGKSKNPRVFKNINRDFLPVKYFSQRSAWMAQEIFSQWLYDCFVPDVQRHLRENNLPKKALLVMDNAPCHPVDKLEALDGNIIAIFLPANTSCLFQPMDQGVIVSMKRRYKKLFMQNLIFCENEVQVEDFWKQYTIKDPIYNIAVSWQDIPEKTLKLSWNKL